MGPTASSSKPRIAETTLRVGRGQVVPVLELTGVIVSTEDHMRDGVRDSPRPRLAALPPRGGMPSIGAIGVCILRSSSALISLLRCFCNLHTRRASTRLSIATCSSRLHARFSATSRSVGETPQDPSAGGQRAWGDRNGLAELRLSTERLALLLEHVLPECPELETLIVGQIG